MSLAISDHVRDPYSALDVLLFVMPKQGHNLLRLIVNNDFLTMTNVLFSQYDSNKIDKINLNEK